LRSHAGRHGENLHRSIAFVFALLFLSPAAHALEGRVLRADGRPVAGYRVSVLGRSQSATCDGAGRFRLDPSPEPPFELLVIGMEGEISPSFLIERLPASGILEIVLPEILRDSITVTSGVAANLDAAPGAATLTLDQVNLAQRLPERLADVVDGVAGATRSEEGPSAVPSLRGMARGRTAILLDGGRLTAERRAGSSATFLNPFTLGSVEIARGAGSVAYGSDAFGGVIDARPRYPDPGPFKLRFDLSASTLASQERSGGFELQRGIGRGALLATVQARAAGDAEAGGGEEIFNSGYRDRGLALRATWPSRFGSWRVSLAADDARDLGKPAADSRVTRTYYPDEASRRLNLGLQTGPQAGWDNFEFSLFAHRYRLVTDRDRFPTATAPRAIERADNASVDLALRAVGDRALAGGRLQLGLDVNSRFGLDAVVRNISFDRAGNRTSTATTLAIDDGSRTDTGIFAVWDRPLTGRLALNAGVRFDDVRSETTGGTFGARSVRDGNFSGQMAFTAGPFADAVATFQLARGFRVPTLSDRFFTGPSGRGIAVGNPDLEPETSLQIDTSLRWARGGRSVALYAYRYDLENLIERYRSGNDFFFRNRGTARVEGTELEAQWPLGERFGLELGASLSRGETPDTGEPVNDISPLTVSATARYTRERLYVFARGSWAAEDDRPGPTEGARPGTTMLDVGSGLTLRKGLELRLVGRNLTDRRYLESADALAAPGRGRSLSLGLLGKF